MGTFREYIMKILKQTFHRETDRDKKFREFIEEKLLPPGFKERIRIAEARQAENQKLKDAGEMLCLEKLRLPRRLKKFLRGKPNLNHLEISDTDLRLMNFLDLARLPKLEFISFRNSKFRSAQLAKLTNVSQFHFERIDFSGADNSPMILPDSVQTLVLEHCSNVENLRNYNKITEMFSITSSDLSGINFDFPNLKHLSVSLIKYDFTKKGSRETNGLDYLKLGQEQVLDMGVILDGCPNLESLTINGDEGCVLKFPNELRSFNTLKNLTVRNFSNLDSIAAIQGEFPNVKKLTITNSISSLQGIFQKFPNLEELIIDSKIDDLSPLLEYREKLKKLTILPEKDQFYQDEKFLRVSLKKLEQLGKIECAQQELQNLRIVIPENFGENSSGINSFGQIIDMIDGLTNKKSGQTQFEITSIPQISEEDKNKLTSRYGFTFVYRIPIEVDIMLERNIAEAENNLHGDEIIKIREELDSLAAEINKEGTTRDKICEVYRIMREKFKLQEVTEFSMTGLDVFLGAEKKDNSESELLTGLTTKELTPKAYICIVNELLKRIGITNMQYKMSKYYMSIEECSSEDRIMREVFGTTSPKMIEAGVTSSSINERLQRQAKEERIHNISAIAGIVEPIIIIPVSKNKYVSISGIRGIRGGMVNCKDSFKDESERV